MFDFDATVVDNETEDDAAPHVPPEAGSVLALVVSFFGEALFEESVGMDASLGEAIHPLTDFNVYPSVFINKVTLVVVVNFFVRDVVEFEVHVFGGGHWCVEIEIDKVYSMEGCARSADC